MEWFRGTTSIAGTQLPNWLLVVGAIIVIWVHLQIAYLGRRGTRGPRKTKWRHIFTLFEQKPLHWTHGIGLPAIYSERIFVTNGGLVSTAQIASNCSAVLPPLSTAFLRGQKPGEMALSIRPGTSL